MKLTHLLSTLTCLTLLLSFVPAADTEAWRLKHGLIRPEIILNHATELKLTAEQQAQLNDMVASAKPRLAPLESAVQEAQSALEAILRNPETTAAAASSQLTQVLEAEGKLKQFQLTTLVELRRLLTPEQRTKALAMAARPSNSELESKVLAEANRLKKAFEDLGLPLTDGLKERGHQIEQLLKAGSLEQALQALHKLASETGVEHPPAKQPLDFSKLETGSTDLEQLKQRLDAIQEKAKTVISIEVITKLLQAREAIDQARKDANAELVGKILTFAETLLEKK